MFPRLPPTVVRVAFVVLLPVAPVFAQCRDWYAGFGVPGLGSTGEIRDMVVHDAGAGPRLWVGGQFSSFGGVSAANVAVWNGNAWSNLGGGLTSGYDYPQCHCVAWFDDGSGAQLYAGGAFTLADGSPAPHIARWNGTSWSDVGGGMNGWVDALAVFDDGTGPALYAAGGFTQAGSNPANRIARWNGTTWSALGTGLNNYASSLCVADDGSGSKLYVGGAFTQAGGIGTNYLARWSSAGWSTMPGLGGHVVSMTRFDDGSGLRLWATAGDRVSRWNGTSWSHFGQISGGSARRIAAIDDGAGVALYVAGAFSSVQSQPRRNIARYVGSSAWEALGWGTEPGLQGSDVWSLVSFDSGAGPELHAGGYFTSAGYWPARSFARYGAPCTAPVVTQNPTDMTAVFGQNAVFDVRAEGTAPLAYQWRLNAVDLVNQSGHLDGATTRTMTISTWNFGDAGVYDCVVSNAQGVAVSNAATFTVPAGGTTGIPYRLPRILFPPEPATAFPPGTNYTTADIPVQSQTGEVLVQTNIPGSNLLVLWDGSSLVPMAQSLTQAPGLAPGVVFSGSNLGPSAVAADGIGVFQAGVQGPGISTNNNTALWFRDPSAIDLVRRRGDQVPGDPLGNVFSETSLHPCVNSAGTVAWIEQVYLGSTFQYQGLFSWTRAGGLQTLARHGTPVPGGGTLSGFIGFPEIGEDGSIAFAANIDLGSGGPPQPALISILGGVLEVLVRPGQVVPGLPAGSTFVSGGNNLIVSATEEITFTAPIQNPNGTTGVGLCRWSHGQIAVIVPPNSPAPGGGPGTTINLPKLAAANSVGDVAFVGDILGACPTCPRKGLWLSGATGIQLIALSAPYAMPDLPSNIQITDFVTVALNDLRQLVFAASVYPDPFNAKALYGWTAIDGLFPIGHPGAQFEVAPGSYRTLAGGWLRGRDSSGGSLRSTSLTPSGISSLLLRFSDWSTGVFDVTFDDIHALYHPCPIVYDEPIDARILPGQDATFTVVAGGQEPLAYQWRRNGVFLADGGAIGGATTPTLSIQAAIESDSGEYDVVVTNNCGSATSAIARLAVEPGAAFCSGDGFDTAATTPCPCANFGEAGHGCANSVAPAGALLTASGAPNPDTVVLHGSGMPPTVSAIYLKGDQDTIAGVVFGDGVRCVDGNLIRLRTKQNAGGASEFPEAGDPSVSVRGQTPPGSGLVGYYQVYYRNAAAGFCPPATFNITNGYSIVW